MKLFFDTETTGVPAKGQYENHLHPQTPILVELGALLTEDDGTIVSAINRIVKPEGWEIPVGASNVHGITTTQAEKEGHDFEETLNEFSEMAKQCNEIVVHNFKYDKLIINGAYHYKFGKIPQWDRYKQTCTMLALVDVCRIPSPYKRGQFKWPKLDEAYFHFFGERVKGAHRALTDVEHTYRIYFKHFHGRDLPLPSQAA